jgi:hypothetical protein
MHGHSNIKIYTCPAHFLHLVLYFFTWCCTYSLCVVLLLHFVLYFFTWCCTSSLGVVVLHLVLYLFTWCCTSSLGVVLLHLVLYSLCAFLGTLFVLRLLLSSDVYFLYLMFICCKRMCICCTLMGICCTVYIAVLTLDAGLLARSQYPEGPATDHLSTGFSWFPCVYKRMLRWFPSFQVATTCLSCSPPDLNSHICVHVK